MKIAIQPVTVHVPNQGLQTATQLDVRIQLYELGESLRCSYEIQRLDNTGDPKNPRVVTVGNGLKELTPEQFAAWGTDDLFVVQSIARNLGLVPA